MPLPAIVLVPKTSAPWVMFGVRMSDSLFGPTSPEDTRTPSVTQGALVFGTTDIAAGDMDRVTAAMAKCPAKYEIRGGPSPILGTYNVTSRPLQSNGWRGVAQQIAHTYPPAQDDVYYEDLTHVVVHRAHVILFLDVTHRKIIGERADSAAKADAVLATVLKRFR